MSQRFVTTTVEVEGREERVVVEAPEVEPLPWGPRARLDRVGSRVPRLDAAVKVTGRARYTADVRLPGMLYAAILRAPVAAGTVERLDVAEARAMPGVQALISPPDVSDIQWLHEEPLLGLRIYYHGQPLAAVAADSLLEARTAVAAIRVTVRGRRHHVGVDPEKRVRAARGAPAPPETVKRERGRVRRALREAPVVVTQTSRVPVALHHPLEPHGSVVWWQDDRVTVYDSTQGIFRVRRELAEALGLPVNRVRVIGEYMGGGFGSKNHCGAYTVLAALLSRKTGRPVKLVLDRREVGTDAGHRPESAVRITLGADRDGRLRAIDAEAWVALGVDGWPGGTTQIARRLYRCPNVRTVEHYLYTNAGAMSVFRAPFYVEGAFALESAMDLLAKRLRLDPAELRARNLSDVDPLRSRPYSLDVLPECLDDVTRRIGWGKRRRRPRWARPGPDDRTARGRGVALEIWGAAGGPPAYAEVRINRDASVLVITGTQDLGTGARTVLAQIAAQVLGVPLDQVHVLLGDTDAGPYAPNSWGSMTTASVGPAVRAAAEDAARQLREAAAGMLNVRPEGLVVRRGRIATASGRKSIALARVTEQLGNIMIVGTGHRGPNPESVTVMSFGAQAAEVEVDLETGEVRVLRIVAAHDCGRAINPELAESQMHGGILQGMGYALFERRVQDPGTGQVLNPGLHEYKIATLADMPQIDARVVTKSDPVANHTGTKGLGEPPIIPTAPAIANAVYDALGVQPAELPLTRRRMMQLIRKARRRR